MTPDFIAFTGRASPVRVVLHPEPEGVYALAYDGDTPSTLIRDDLYDTLEDARKFCEIDYGIPRDAWRPHFAPER